MADLPPDLLTPKPTDPSDDDLAQLDPSVDDGANDKGLRIEGEDDSDFEEQEDGSVIIRDKAKDAPNSSEFDDNLAESGLLDESFLNRLGMDMVELVEADKEARTERDKQYAEGIKKTGMSNSKSVGADFDGSSSVTHPMLAKGCVDFASKAIKELFPSSGPVRTQIIGEQSDIKVERAERKKTYMNWQLTEQVPEHRPEFEKMLGQLPLGGSQYKRWWYDQKMGRPRTAAVYIDDIFLPFDQNDFYTTPRLTHREFIGEAEYNARVDSLLYRDLDLVEAGDQPERSDAAKAARDVEGVSDDGTAYNKTGGTREVFTMYVDLEVEDDPITGGDLAPYILHVEEHGGKVLGLYRNWKETDERRLKLHWIVEYNFIPWRGAYAIGLYHLIGSMATASTGAINALLDSAHINNFPGGVKLRGGRTSGQTINVNPTELQELDAPPGVDDIRKLAMPFPFNGPSTVLYQLLEWLTQQAEIVVATASEKIADGGSSMPMGTALALIEGGATNFSAIHARLHHSARRELEILHRLDATYLNDQETVDELGELVVYRKDFMGPMDVLPVSDPNIFSEAQRYAQFQALLQLAENPMFGQFFKADRLLVRALKLLQIPYGDDIANLPLDPKRLPPCDENVAASTDQGTPLKVFEEQDDLAHMESHLTYMTSPIFGGSPLIGSIALPKLMQHVKEHLVAFYKKNHQAAAYAIKAIAQMQGHDLTDEQAQSKGHAFADQTMAKILAPMVAPAMQQAQQLLQKVIQPPPPDPNTRAALASQEKIEGARLQADAQENDKGRKFKAEQASSQQALDMALEKMEQDANRRATDMATMVERMEQEGAERMATLSARLDQQKTQLVEDNKLFLAEMNNQNAAALEVLKTALTQQAAAMPDISAVIQPMLVSLQENAAVLQQQFEQHGQGTMQALMAVAQSMQAMQPKPSRGHRLVKDPNGNTIGIEPVPDEPVPPPSPEFPQ
jgi:hypothetical protein